MEASQEDQCVMMVAPGFRCFFFAAAGGHEVMTPNLGNHSKLGKLPQMDEKCVKYNDPMTLRTLKIAVKTHQSHSNDFSGYVGDPLIFTSGLWTMICMELE